MAGPAKNICIPTEVYGGFDHMLFLGCSVMGFSASAGWNGQQSEMTVQLVDDNCAGQKYYYDANLQKQSWTDPDPGFYGLLEESGDNFNLIGAPTYFRIGDFEFSGLVQSWRELHSASENPAYEVKLVAPSQLIENAQLIINDYAGNVAGLFNVFNIYGYLESFGASCTQYYQSSPAYYIPGSGAPDGAVFGSPAQAYGGADVNSNGMQWAEMLNGILASTSTWQKRKCPS